MPGYENAPAPSMASLLSRVQGADDWAPYQSEFGEASRQLVDLTQSADTLSLAETDPELSSSVAALPASELLRTSRVLELCIGLRIFLTAMGMGSPASVGTGGASAPPAVPAHGGPPVREARPDATEELTVYQQPVLTFTLASRLFRPPRVGSNRI